MQYDSACFLGMLADAVATGKHLDGVLIKLAKGHASSPSSVADFTEADFDGYPSPVVAAAWSGPRLNPDSTYGRDQIVSFTGTGASTPPKINVITAVYMTDAGGTVLLGFELWDANPVALGAALSQLNLTVPIFAQDGSFGGAVVRS